MVGRCGGWIRMAVAAVPALLLLQAARAAQTYPGVIALDVDASDIAHRIFRVVETIPARPGRFELYYPQWLPGEHSAGGRVGQLAGLRFRVNGAELACSAIRSMSTISC